MSDPSVEPHLPAMKDEPTLNGAVRTASTYERYPKECSRHCKEDEMVEFKANVFIVECL